MSNRILTKMQELHSTGGKSLSVVLMLGDPDFETSFELEPASEVKLVIYYDLPQEFSITKDNTNYSLLWQKQAGAHGDDFLFSFDIPFGMNYLGGSEFLEKSEGSEDKVGTAGKLNEDLKVNINLE